jgi:hypothetical protein
MPRLGRNSPHYAVVNAVSLYGFVAEILPTPPITRNQVELMGKDNIPEPDAPGFEALHISPQAIENILPHILQAAREKAEAVPVPDPNLGEGGRKG